MLQIKENDGLPNYLCMDCEDKVNTFVDFQTLIISSDSELRKTLLCDQNEHFTKIIVTPLELKEETNCDSLLETTLKSEGKLEIKKKSNRKKPLYCKECDQTFRYRRELVAHDIIHTGIIPYTCEICNKNFTQRWVLKNHQRCHFEERPFKCEECGKAYK
jgi:hypothetical protein